MKEPKLNGFTIRPATMDDLDGVCEAIDAYSQDLHGVGTDNRKHVILTWEQPGFQVDTDTRVAVTSDGRVIGYAEVEDTEEPHVQIYSWVRIHPDYQKSGLASQFLAWINTRALEAVEQAPGDARVSLFQGVPHEDVRARKLLEDNGFCVVRYFLRMDIKLDHAIPEPIWPEGLEVRTFNLGEDLEAAVRVFRETFNDHWGHVEMSFEEQATQWDHRYRNDPEFDGTLSSLVLFDGELIGLSLCDLRHPEDPTMGIVTVLGVRREWRRRGIARALLHRSFREMQARGQQSVCLGVDAASLTGAVRVYEAAGMKPSRQTDAYEKELRTGEDLSLQTLDSGDSP